ncbi:hypothetical protein [Flavobacterium agrisoli]|uniref:Uncharacterized protein n=1 Tax=Flavobacterium agrisoli TaxID=2793066 RepID=A0A934UKM9_9FLAO|nr:hypothetical protein [Flavobacterium agrisoli]MBK0370728.1 hypothetical protein [Flavobacterium agrisoli]
MKTKVYIYGLCNVFYDAFYIQGLKGIYGNLEFNISKFTSFNYGTFACIIENGNETKKIIIDSKDSNKIDEKELKWCDIYGKINNNENNLLQENSFKIISIGPSFGIKIWNLFETFYHLSTNFIRFSNSIVNKREFIANYWRQYKRLRLNEYTFTNSSQYAVFFINSIWKNEGKTNNNRASFIKVCREFLDLDFEGGFAARSNGDNLGFEDFVYSKKISLKKYIKKIKQSAFVFNTPAVLDCHGWKLGEFLAMGKAIISTPLYNQMPAVLINRKHLLIVENEKEIKNSIILLLNDLDFKKKMEIANRLYFDEFLAPKKVLSRLIERV